MANKEKKVKPENNKKSKKEEKNKRHFFKDFKAELKRVVWPTPKQLVNSTIAVITMVLVIGIIVFGLDMVFELLNKQNAKLQSSLQEKYSNSIEYTNTTSNTDEASSVNVNTTENTTNTVE
jgi:preprotein translocase subunit SecE